jgi:hypothetical protein
MPARLVISLDGTIVGEIALEKPVTVVGRSPDCDVVIEHAAVSTRHALFRVVDRTVYVEDLASTNGTLVNGLAVGTQVLHHLDLVEIGRHKLHFFEESLLGGSVSDLERTVTTDFERTMLAGPVDAGLGQGQVAARGDEGLSRTVRMAALPAQAPPAAEMRHALRGIAGPQAGQLVELERANTMIGIAGADAALVVKRAGALFLARLSGRRPTRLNGRDLGPGTHPLKEGDRIEVGAAGFEVVRLARELPNLEPVDTRAAAAVTTVIHGAAREDS